jgi:HEAT repeat protein
MRTIILTLSAGLVLAGGGICADVPKKEDVPKLIKALKDSTSAKVRAQAAEDLGHRGAIRASDVKDAIEPLLNAVRNDREATVRAKAAAAIGRIAPDPKESVKVLIEALEQDKVISVRAAAALSLGAFGADAKEALPALKQAAAEADKVKGRELRRAAGDAMRQINSSKKK